METKFQKTLVNDNETLWKIVKLFHPDIPETVTNSKGEILSVKDNVMKAETGKYDWVSIIFSVKDYGCISIGISNCYNATLWGDKVTKEMMRRALVSNDVTFNIWRFGDDKLNKTTNYKIYPIDDECETLYDEYKKILTDAGYELQSVDEWYELYYVD